MTLLLCVPSNQFSILGVINSMCAVTWRSGERYLFMSKCKGSLGRWSFQQSGFSNLNPPKKRKALGNVAEPVYHHKIAKKLSVLQNSSVLSSSAQNSWIWTSRFSRASIDVPSCGFEHRIVQMALSGQLGPLTKHLQSSRVLQKRDFSPTAHCYIKKARVKTERRIRNKNRNTKKVPRI